MIFLSMTIQLNSAEGHGPPIAPLMQKTYRSGGIKKEIIYDVFVTILPRGDGRFKWQIEIDIKAV
jgi:hypothetical protein